MNWLIEFIFPHRVHRLAYLLRILATNAVLYCIFGIGAAQGGEAYIRLLCVVALIAYQLFFIALPRVRDIGMNGWWLLLVLVPVANIVFGIMLLLRAPATLSNRPNTALEPTAAAPSVSDVPGNPKVSDSSTSASGGGGSAFGR